MFKRSLAFLCVAAAAYGIVPRPLADIQIPTPDSKKINLRQYRGKVVLIALISTTCGDCIKSVGMLNSLQQDFGKRGFQVVAAAIEDNAAYAIGSFVARYRPSFPVGYLDRETAIKFLDISPTTRPFVPIMMFVDGRGTVRLQYFGNDTITKQGDKAIRPVVNGLIRQAEIERGAKKAEAKPEPAKAEP